MKQRLNLTIDRKVLHRAKVFARNQNKSLSALVDEYLQRVTGEENVELDLEIPFSAQWMGALTLREDPGDLRLEGLKRKHGL